MENRSSIAKRLSAIPQEVVTVFFATRVSIVLLSLSAYYLYRVEMVPGHFLWMGLTPSINPFLRVWERWDALHYLSILQNGYTWFQSGALNTAFFPLYPLLGYLVKTIVQDPSISLLLVSNVASFGALVFVYKLVALDYGEKAARRAILYVSIFPYAFVLVGMYTESLFLLNLAATLYYARTERWGVAMVWGVLLTATRLVGVAAVPALLWEYMSQRNWEWRKIDVKILTIAAMTLGLLAYMTYTYLAFGDFFSLVHSSTLGWDRHAEWPWVGWQNHVRMMEEYRERPMLLFTAVFVIGGLLLTSLLFGRLRPTYVILGVLLIAIPLSSNQVGGIPRYLLANLPLFILLAKFGGNRFVHMSITVLFVLYLAVFTTLYANWTWIG